MDDTEDINYKAIVDQLQHENETLRERLTHALNHSPINEAIDGIVLVVQRSDPMKVYIWACIAFMVVMAIARLLEVLIK